MSEQTPTGPVLACFAHPDDAEICAGGTLAKWASAGREVHLLVLTNGDRGSDDPARDRAELARTRAVETESGARVLGLASARVFGDVHDGELENTAAIRDRVVRVIREVRPQTLVANDPTAWIFDGEGYVNHTDHRTAGAIALDSVFPGAGNPHFFARHLAEGLSAWSVRDVWLGWTLQPNRFEDITPTMPTKLSALAEHKSQVEDDLLGHFREWLPKEAAEAGARIGVEHAEAFRCISLD